MAIGPIAPENEVKVRNLLVAFESDRSAHAKCSAFASQADSEGLHGVASLFRAVARARQIHADNHAHVIQQLGGEPTVPAHAVEITTTLENLRMALADEVYVTATYPTFLTGSNLNEDDSADQSLHWAIRASQTRVPLFSDAIALIEAGRLNSWIATARQFYVRRACGYTSEIHQPERCWMCDRLCGTFEIIG